MIGSLSLDQLRVLVAIGDAGSFSAAGRSLGRVQSAISQSVKTLEEVQGVELFDRTSRKPSLTPVGRVLIEQARTILASADRFEAIAAGTRMGLEPALTIAIDPLVPTEPLIDSLRALRDTFPDLPVSFSTEGVGGAVRRLRAESASLAFCLLLPSVPADLMAYSIMDLKLIPVAAADHPLVRLARKLDRADLEAHVQLVLSDAVGVDGPSYGVIASRVWRFVDLARRLDFLLAGFGWCKMPPFVVEPYLKDGRLIELDISDESISPTGTLPVYAAHVRGRPLGRAGSWLLDDLRQRLMKKQVAKIVLALILSALCIEVKANDILPAVSLLSGSAAADVDIIKTAEGSVERHGKVLIVWVQGYGSNERGIAFRDWAVAETPTSEGDGNTFRYLGAWSTFRLVVENFSHDAPMLYLIDPVGTTFEYHNGDEEAWGSADHRSIFIVRSSPANPHDTLIKIFADGYETASDATKNGLTCVMSVARDSQSKYSVKVIHIADSEGALEFSTSIRNGNEYSSPKSVGILQFSRRGQSGRQWHHRRSLKV